MKVIVCKDEPKETILYTDVHYTSMVVAKWEKKWFLLSHAPVSPSWFFWKNMGNSNSRLGSGHHAETEDAIAYAFSENADVYSFNNLDEFIQFYQEEK